MAGCTLVACSSSSETGTAAENYQLNPEIAVTDSTPASPLSGMTGDTLKLFMVDESSFAEKVPVLMGKDISFYIEHDDLPEDAIDMYLGALEPDEGATSQQVLRQVYAGNSQLRPFYFHLLNMAIDGADGALAESLGAIVVDFVSKQPQAFTSYLLNSEYSGRRKLFDDYVFFSQFEVSRQGSPGKTLQKYRQQASNNCQACSEKQQELLNLFFNSVAE